MTGIKGQGKQVAISPSSPGDILDCAPLSQSFRLTALPD